MASEIWPHGRYRFDFTGAANHAGTTRMEDRADLARIRAGFLEAIPTYPSPIMTIDATADPDAVARQIQEEVAHALAIDPRP